MTATQGTDALAASGLTQRLGPCASGQGDGAGTKRKLPPAFAILGQQAADFAVLPCQLDHAHAVERLAGVGARLIQHAQHQPGVVGQRVGEAAAAEQAVVLQSRRQVAQLLAWVEAMVAAAGQGVVQRQQAAEHPWPGKLAAIVRHDEAQRLDQPRRLGQQALALAHRVAGQAELALGDIAEAAVDHLRRAA
ncbi:hypothetical protein D3C76_556630 [compost metagenome]